MSLLIKKLEQVSAGAGQPIGFGAAGKGMRSPMVMIACLSQVEAELVQTAVSGKVDALFFDLKNSTGQADQIAEILPDDSRIPWGVRLQKTDIEGLNTLADAGCDFILISPETAAHALAEERMGKVLEVDISLQDGLARAIGQLSLDAILLSDTKRSGTISVNEMANYGRIVSFIDKPALAYLPTEVSDLGSLRDAGISGTIMDFSGKDLEAKIKAVQDAIADLAMAKKKSRKGSYAFVPSIGFAGEELESEY